uniref:N-acetylgalactosaminide beta-1,3-galactosyltransferase n=1 Tax=Acrobeloides nanus TaxID=290746 RepID=A0A914CYE9_9BILA
MCSPILNVTKEEADLVNSKSFVYQNNSLKTAEFHKKLLCWVHTMSDRQNTRALAVNETWLKRCDYGIFFTNKKMKKSLINHYSLWDDCENNIDALNKTIRAWRFVFSKLLTKFDWYYKADDDTFMLTENLKKFLQNFDPMQPHYFGVHYKQTEENGNPYGSASGFNSGSGYILSYEAVRLLNKALDKNPYFCGDFLYEDVGLGNCLAKLNIFPAQTTYENGNHS